MFVRLFHQELRPALYNNVVVTGGSAKFPNFLKRLEDEVRKMAADVYEVSVRFGAEDPAVSHWAGGAAVSTTPLYETVRVTKGDYEENGGSRLAASRAADADNEAEASTSDTEDSAA
jgi:actin-related protein 6